MDMTGIIKMIWQNDWKCEIDNSWNWPIIVESCFPCSIKYRSAVQHANDAQSARFPNILRFNMSSWTWLVTENAPIGTPLKNAKSGENVMLKVREMLHPHLARQGKTTETPLSDTPSNVRFYLASKTQSVSFFCLQILNKFLSIRRKDFICLWKRVSRLLHYLYFFSKF